MTVSQALERYLAAHHAHALSLAHFMSAEEWLVDAMIQTGGPNMKGNMLQAKVGGYNVKLIRTDGRWKPLIRSLGVVPESDNGST